MIQPLKYSNNINFKGTSQKSNNNEKFSLRKGLVSVLKSYNTVTSTTQGVLRGTAEGIAAAGIIGLIGKNIKQANSNIFGTFGGMIKDAGKAIINTAKFVPALITKSPLENIKTVVKLPKEFYKTYLKNSSKTAALATIGAVGIFAFRAIQGKINGNLKNADVDHATKSQHY